MNKKWLLLPLVLLLYRAQAQKVTDSAHSLLWKIEKPGQQLPSYVFGTIHAICADDYVWTPVMDSALKQSFSVCFEMNLNDPSLAMTLAYGLMEPEGKSLADHFTQDQYARLRKYMRDSLGQNLDMYSRMKPFALQSLFITGTMGCDSMVSAEDNILKEALAQNMSVQGLETAQEQLLIANSIPVDSIVAFIMGRVDGKASSVDEDELYRQLITAYKQQNLPLIDSIIASSDDITSIKGDLLDKRNIKWMAAMQPMMKQQPVFFAVGAGHLWGEFGVLELLRKLQFKVTPVK